MSDQTLWPKRIKACTAMGASLANAGYSRSFPLPNSIQSRPLQTQVSTVFPEGFRDETYMDWERGYKWRAHQEWQSVLNRKAYRRNCPKESIWRLGRGRSKLSPAQIFSSHSKRWPFATR